MSDAIKIPFLLACLAVTAACTADEPPPEPLDQAMATYHTFECGDAGPARVRFVGPETIELLMNDESLILVRERSASGAKYVADDIVFWNKGDEAMLETGAERFSCTRLPEDTATVE